MKTRHVLYQLVQVLFIQHMCINQWSPDISLLTSSVNLYAKLAVLKAMGQKWLDAMGIEICNLIQIFEWNFEHEILKITVYWPCFYGRICWYLEELYFGRDRGSVWRGEESSKVVQLFFSFFHRIVLLLCLPLQKISLKSVARLPREIAMCIIKQRLAQLLNELQ